MKQTAVEFLFEKIKSNIDAEDGSMNMNWMYDDTFEQAKEIEKQQIINAYKKAHEDGYHFEGSASDYEAEGLEEHLSEQYYNETFKK